MKVTDCGCFGDFIKLKPWETFYKDCILDVMILILVLNVKFVRPVFGDMFRGTVATFMALGSLIFCLYNVYSNEPVIDFRPYKIGNDIIDLRKEKKPEVRVMEFHFHNKTTKQWDVLSHAATAPDLAGLLGKRGTLCVSLVDYGGFEPVQRIVAAAVVDGSPIDPLLAAQLIYLQAGESAAGDDDAAVDADMDSQSLDDAVDEAVFVDQRVVEKGEQQHFEQAIGQLERFVEDKILVCRRERTSIAEKLKSARERRDEIVGATARERIQADIERLATRDENLERRIEALESREDEVYRKWRNEYHELRYRAPTITRLFQAAFQIVAGTSC